jgi:hypothetical protein
MLSYLLQKRHHVLEQLPGIEEVELQRVDEKALLCYIMIF